MEALGRNKSRVTFAAGLLLLIGPGAVSAQAPPVFIAQTVDSTQAPAPLEKLDADWSIHLGGEAPRTVGGSEWISLRQAGKRMPPYPTSNCALLTTGDQLLLEPKAPFRIDDEQVWLRLGDGSEVHVPLAYLSYVCLRVPKGVDNPARFLARLGIAKRSSDVIYLANGDSLEGTLTTPARGPVYTMTSGDRKVNVPLDQIAVLAINTDLQARPKTKKTFAHVVTTSGARLQFSTLRPSKSSGAQAGYSGKTLYGADLEVSLTEITALTIRNGAADYLSDLTPKAYKFTPFFGVNWPLTRDTDLNGNQLALGEDFYDKGLAMHAKSEVSYTLQSKYRWLDASLGLGAGSLKITRVKVSVCLDGKSPVFTKTLARRDGVVPVKIDVRGAREMTLLVDFGDFGDVQASVHWADARLIRDGK